MAKSNGMSGIRLKQLRSQLQKAEDSSERLSILNSDPLVQSSLATPSFFSSFLKGMSLDCECVLKQLVALDAGIDFTIESAEKWRDLLTVLLPVDAFYREMGGLVGYHVEVLELLEKKKSSAFVAASYHAPIFEDISNETKEVVEQIQWGIEATPLMAELYPLGGAADRLHLVDEKSGLELPAAKLRFAGKTLLEHLLRDLAARERLYFLHTGKQCTVPVGIMTSREKDNHTHVMALCEENNWFGRGKENFRFFIQPLVPAVNDRGKWHWTAPLKPLLKPGGHGALWKLARDEGVLRWFQSLGRTKVLVRQINNPIAGLDYGLFAFTGIGAKQEMSFGFASCPRLVKSAEGMNVLVETEQQEFVLTNIEYCDFAKFGIEDRPIEEGSSYSQYSSNTNILFADLKAVEQAVERSPYPGLLINLKTASIMNESGEKKDVPIGRLESTMQNLADVFLEPKNEAMKTKKTFVTYNKREKTICVAKKAFVAGKPLLETTEHCFYELCNENLSLLSSCGFSVPAKISADEYLIEGPSALFLYHPALGPLYSLIRKKIRGGTLSAGSELILEIAEVEIENLHVQGSLQVKAMSPLGRADEQGVVRYSSDVGNCRLKNVTIENGGIDWSISAPYWKMELKRRETVEIILKGDSELIAENLVLKGSHRFVVESGVSVTLSEENGEIVSKSGPKSRS